MHGDDHLLLHVKFEMPNWVELLGKREVCRWEKKLKQSCQGVDERAHYSIRAAGYPPDSSQKFYQLRGISKWSVFLDDAYRHCSGACWQCKTTSKNEGYTLHGTCLQWSQPYLLALSEVQ